MARNVLQDMVRTKRVLSTQLKRVEKEEITDEIRASNKGSKYRIYLVALVSVVFLLFALSFLFSLARVDVTPKIEEITLNGNFSATKDGNAEGPSFDLVVISGEESKPIQGGEQKEVVIKATGTVIIYNNFSTASQGLDIDTRLEGSNGKIYKTTKKITIPGMTKDSNPGSVEVNVYGAEAGEEYNSEPIDFKIFGLKGTPKYAKFYARSKGNMTGGFKGMSPFVSLLDKTTAVNELKAILKERFLKQAVDQTPPNFILFKDAATLAIDDKNITFTPNEENKILVNVKGTLFGFLLEEKKLTKKIVESVVDGYNGSEVYIKNIKDLSLSLDDKENISFADAKNIKFSLSGKAFIVWKVDEVKLANDIVGKKKKDFRLMLAPYSNIDKAELVMRPFWKTHFPEEIKNIEIVVDYPVN